MVSSAYANVLEPQLEVFQQQAETIVLGSGPSGYAELDAVLGLALSVFQQLQRLELRVAHDIDAHHGAGREAASRALAALYARWYAPSIHLQRALKECAATGFIPENGASFRNACRYARVPALHIEELLEVEARASQP